jgi:hypothetical protein
MIEGHTAQWVAGSKPEAIGCIDPGLTRVIKCAHQGGAREQACSFER